jgi:hypothetical protein
MRAGKREMGKMSVSSGEFWLTRKSYKDLGHYLTEPNKLANSNLLE